MQARHVIRIVFGEHMKSDKIRDMSSTFMSSGDVTADPDGRTFAVETTREGKRDYLIETLKGWEQGGFVRWEQIS